MQEFPDFFDFLGELFGDVDFGSLISLILSLLGGIFGGGVNA
jgi:hypothetical protein